MLLFILLLIVSSLFVDCNRIYEKDSPFYRFLMNTLVLCTVFLFRIRIHVAGREIVPESSRFLLVCNHVSGFDPFVELYVLRKHKLAFVSKEDNLHIPVIGRLIRRCGTLAIDREKARNAMSTIIKAAELINKGELSMSVYPEGTRSRTGELLPFHNGVFKIAQKATVPVVIAVIRGTEQIRKRFPWRYTDVYLSFVDVIPASYLVGKRTELIGERVRDSILNNMN